MSKADKIFVENANAILKHGTSTKGQKVRPHWPDGTPAYTIKKFFVANEFNLDPETGEFPATTLRKTPIKSATDEILWIWQKKSNKVSELGSHVWDQWVDANGTIGKAYGYQMGKKSVFRVIKTKEQYEDYKAKVSAYNLPSATFSETFGTRNAADEGAYTFLIMDQTDTVLFQLLYEPFSRRIITNIFCIEELTEMMLQPCCYSVTFNVTDEGRPDGKLTLNAILNQRSNDMLAAFNWNTVQHAVLLCIVAQCVGMVPGTLAHVIADQHIYDRHIELVKELIERPQYPAPKVWLTPDKTDFYAFTKDDVHVEDYVAGEQMHFEVAI